MTTRTLTDTNPTLDRPTLHPDWQESPTATAGHIPSWFEIGRDDAVTKGRSSLPSFAYAGVRNVARIHQEYRAGYAAGTVERRAV